MNTASHVMDTASGFRARAAEAWSAFWADSAQSRCAAGAPGIWVALSGHWESFGRSLEAGTRVLDLGCGAGVVGQLLLDARSDLRITGIDSAKIPPSTTPRLALMPQTDMESMPFAGRQFGAVVSQFGFEYSQMNDAVREIARVLEPGAKLSFLVHHAESSIVHTTRARLKVIEEFLGPTLCAAFCSADVTTFSSELSALIQRHQDDALAAHPARALPPRLSSPHGHRLAIWTALEVALEPERRVSESLMACCVKPPQLEEWLEPLRCVCDCGPIPALREVNGEPVAWIIQGVVSPPSHAVAPAS
jgi:SAM-dependent methyltransferase